MGQGASVLAEAAQELSTRVDVIEMQDEEFWSRFWPKDQALTYDQMYKAFTADALREVRSQCPKNLATLIRRGIVTLAAHTRQGAVASKEARVQVGNLVRLLTRVIPIIFEDPSWEDFWLTSTPVGVKVTLPEGSIADGYNKGCPENIREEAIQQRQADLAAAEMPTNPPPPLYETLLTAIQDLLLAPEYTALRKLPRTSPFGSSPPQSCRPLAAVHALDLTWYPGVEASTASVDKPSFVEPRCELLRLLIACLSRPLYHLHTQLDVRADPWASFVVSGVHRNTLVLARSLLNAVCTYDPIGYGMPYNYVMVPDDDRDKLAQLSGEVLCLLLDFVPYPQPGDPEGASHGTNIYIDWIASLKTEEDLDVIADNFARLLNNPLQGSYLPASFKHVDMHHELITLFWRICETNRHFVSRTLRTGKVLEIVLPVLYRLNENKNVPGQVGFVHICVYTLLLLSGQRNFSVRLNKEWDADVRFEGIPFSNGNYADLMIMVLHAVLTTNNRRLTSLYELILTIIVNISPFVKRLSLQSANKLVHLFQVFSSRKYLFASEPNHRLVFFLLEAFNNLVQYQFEGNQHLVYCIIRRRALFYDLSALTIPREQEQDTAASEAPAQEEGQEAQQSGEGDGDDDDGDDDEEDEEGRDDAHEQQQQQPEVPEQRPGEAPNAVDPNHKLPPHAKHPEYPTDKQQEALNVYAPEKPVSEAPPKKQRAMIKTTLARNDPAEHFTVAEEVKEADASDNTQQQEESSAEERGAMQPARSGWQPTQEWLDTWFPHLPLQTIQRLLKVLVPQVEKLCSDKGVTHEVEVIEFLKNGTLVGLLPVPHPIITRRYQGSGRSSIWFTSYFWSVIFLKNLTPPFLFDTDVRLFAVKVVD